LFRLAESEVKVVATSRGKIRNGPGALQDLTAARTEISKGETKEKRGASTE